ncbi:MAG: ATP-binding protein [Longimicrobiales bacterium]
MSSDVQLSGLSRVLERSLVGLFALDNERVTYANEFLRDLLGYDEQDVPTLDVAELISPQDAVVLARQFTGTDALDRVRFCTPLRRKDGGVEYVEIRASHMEVDGRSLVTGIIIDITEMVRGRVELNDHAARLRRVFDDGLAGIVVADAEGRITSANPEFLRLAGFGSLEETIGTPIESLELEPGGFRRLLERVKSAGGVTCDEIDLLRRDGEAARVLAKLSATTDPDEGLLELRASLLDITERARTEGILRRSHERLRLIELATKDVIWDWNVTTGQIKWSGAAAKLFRYRSDEVKRSINWHLEHIHLEDRERVVRGIDRLISGVEDSWSDEYRFLRGDSSYASVFDRAFVVRNGRNEPVRVIGWMLDVTERKRAETAHRLLANASTVLETTLDADVTAHNFVRLCVPDLADVCTLDFVTDDHTIRPAAALATRPGPDGVIHPGALPEDSANVLREAADEAVRLGESVFVPSRHKANGRRRERVHRRRDPKTDPSEDRPRSLLALPLIARGRVLGVATLAMTHSRRRFTPMDLLLTDQLAQRAAAALDNARLYQTAQGALDARDEILRVISHDLREPLNTIVAAVELVSNTVRERREESRRWLTAIERSADQMNALIDDLLDSANIEAKRFSIATEPKNAREFLREATDLLRPLAEARKIRFESHIDSNVPVVEMDEKQLMRVLSNVVGNAIKFTPSGGTIRIRGEGDDEELRVSVEDSGPGIPEAKREHIFERFWKGESGDRRGAGLGLSIAKGIIDAHGGRIWAESKNGGGSRFTFTLPAGSRT